MLNRFLSSDVGRQILARSTSLEIRMYRSGDKVGATYELHGCVGTDPFADDEDEEGDTLTKRSNAEDMRFIVDLMNQFERAK